MVDLRGLTPEHAARRVGCLTAVPDNAGVIVIVGVEVIEPAVLRRVREHAARLDLEVWAENPHATDRWVSALNGDDLLGPLGVA